MNNKSRDSHGKIDKNNPNVRRADQISMKKFDESGQSNQNNQ